MTEKKREEERVPQRKPGQVIVPDGPHVVVDAPASVRLERAQERLRDREHQQETSIRTEGATNRKGWICVLATGDACAPARSRSRTAGSPPCVEHPARESAGKRMPARSGSPVIAASTTAPRSSRRARSSYAGYFSSPRSPRISAKRLAAVFIAVRNVLVADQRSLPFGIELVLELVPVAQLDLVRLDDRGLRLLEEDREERVLGDRRVLERGLGGRSILRVGGEVGLAVVGEPPGSGTPRPGAGWCGRPRRSASPGAGSECRRSASDERATANLPSISGLVPMKVCAPHGPVVSMEMLPPAKAATLAG